MATGAAGAALAAWAAREALRAGGARPGKLAALAGRQVQRAGAVTMEKLTAYKDVTSYNNYYEFGTDKADPAKNAAHAEDHGPGPSRSKAWSRSPASTRIEDLLKLSAAGRAHLPPALRRRLVDGDSLGRLFAGRADQGVEPLGNAKYVEFVTLADPKTMPFVGSRVLDWPYVEGLRMDEAMHPLTLLTFGLYGEVLPNQNGAPVRLVVPWKYGFKSGKSIVKIRFIEKQPSTAWNKAAANEYGFYSNVNPERRPPALEPGHRAPHRRGRPVRQEAQDADVQRLRGAGRPAVRRHGPEEELLMAALPRSKAAAASGGQAAAVRAVRCCRLRGWCTARSPTALGANPAEYLIRATGDWTLRFLCITLAVTPLRVITKHARAGALSPHAGPVRVLLRGAALAELQLVRHGLRRRRHRQGHRQAARSSWWASPAFVLLTPLAATSFNRAIKALGAKRWQALHKLVYVIAGLGLLHFFWMRAGKNNFAEVAVYAAIVARAAGLARAGSS